MPRTSAPSVDFLDQLSRVRAAGVLRFDLTEDDPARCGLGPGDREVAALLASRGGAGSGAPGAALTRAREAIASYLAGHDASVRPDRIFLAGSRAAAHRLALAAACDPGGEVLVAAPARPFLAGDAARPTRTYALEFGEAWRLARRSVRRAAVPEARALWAGNPAEPTGALLTRDELAFLGELCAGRGLSLVGDEAFLDTALGARASVARATGCLAVHVSGLSGVCGLPRLGVEWVALAGPAPLVAGAAERARAWTAAAPPLEEAAVAAVPALLARREPFLEARRARLARNRGLVAGAALGEAPWTLQWGGGGCWAVLQVNPVRDETELCLALLGEGVAVRPGHLDGLPGTGYLSLSLLPDPGVFEAGLERLERHLRGAEQGAAS